MKPLSQPSGMHFVPSSHPTTFPAYQYNRPAEVKPMNFQTQPQSQSQAQSQSQGLMHAYSHPVLNSDQQQKKILSTIKTVQDKKQYGNINTNSNNNNGNGFTPTVKKVMKYQKPAFLGASNKQTQNSDTTTLNSDGQNLKKQESEPDLRTTCPNVFRKMELSGNYKDQVAASNLRYTAHGSKFGAVITQAKKFDEQQQKTMKKMPIQMPNSFLSPSNASNYVPPSPYKSMTQTKKPTQVKYKSLDQYASNKQRNQKRGLKKIINGFQIYKPLGKGKFGQVYLAEQIQTGFVVALKKIIKAKVIQYKMIEQFKRQIRLHSALDHPNIVKFYGFFQDAQNIYLILEYINGGTLFDYLAQKDTLSPKEAAEFLKDTLEALCYMHQKSIAHRDIKPENIVLTAHKVAKLCDFGWSALVQSSRTTYCGTFDYAPPQILQRKNYDIAVDMWCVGVLAFQLLTGRVPFQGEQRKQIKQKIISVDKTKIVYPKQIPEDAKNFIQQLVQKDPTLRPKCKDLLKHPFIVNNTKKPTPMPKQKQKQKEKKV